MLPEILIGTIYLLVNNIFSTLKISFMNTVFIIFVRAIFYYLALTLPSLIMLEMYFFSAFFAVSVCWIAGLIFAAGFYLLKQLTIQPNTKFYLLFLFVVLGVFVAFECIELFHLWDHIWSNTIFLLFPLAALIAGCISLLVAKQAMIIQFKNESYVLEIIDNNSL